ncbi:MAG: hypothetical protein U5P41_07100 [Gammaproteobacteria bacterium]|nr:hypothetical protein [Gammaproteobacteria bacterium]
MLIDYNSPALTLNNCENLANLLSAVDVQELSTHQSEAFGAMLDELGQALAHANESDRAFRYHCRSCRARPMPREYMKIGVRQAARSAVGPG